MKRGHLDGAIQAFAELASNKFRYGLLKKIRQWSKFFEAQIGERDDMRGKIVTQYLKEGEDSVSVDHPEYEKCVQDLMDLFNEELEGMPSSIDVDNLPEDMKLSGHTFTSLIELGVLVENDAH